MVNEAQVVEKKLGMSLDELIAEQKKKQGTRPATGPRRKTFQPKKNTSGRVLVVPRPQGVPRPGPRGIGLKGPRGGGITKGSPAPKFIGGRQQQGGGFNRQLANRNVKITIGNKLSGRAPTHLPTSGVLSKPFVAPAAGNGRAPMQIQAPAGASLSTRFDTLAGAAPQGPARPTGQPRRNAHGVILP